MEGEEEIWPDEVLEKGRRNKETKRIFQCQNTSDQFHFISVAIFPTNHQPRRLGIFYFRWAEGHSHHLALLENLTFVFSTALTNPLVRSKLTVGKFAASHTTPAWKSLFRVWLLLGSGALFIWAACPVAGMAKDQSWSTCTHQYLPFQMAAPTAGGRTKGMLIAMLFSITAWGSLEAEWFVQGADIIWAC